MDTLEAMRVFVAVVDHNGFSAAADTLDMSTPAVTRHVAWLEDRLDARLLNRTTRRIGLTATGAAYYQRCLDLLARFDEVEALIGSQALVPAGTLRINAPVSFGIARLGPLLAGFHAAHPQVQLELDLSDRLVDMVEEGYDLALRITRSPADNLIARRLGDVHLLLCAAPDYLAQRGVPLRTSDLAEHDCLSYRYWSGGDAWTLLGPDGEHSVRIHGSLLANNGDVLRQAALAGMGIILQPDFLIAEDIAQGRLIRVLPDHEVPAIGLFAVYPSRSHLAPKVRSFIDYLAAELKTL